MINLFSLHFFRAAFLLNLGFAFYNMSNSAEAPTVPSVPKSASSSAAATPEQAASSGSPKENAVCPEAEVVGVRIKEAAKLNLAEESALGGGFASQAGEIVSNIGGFGGLFNLLDTGASLSGHKKLADAIAADPCGETLLAALPRPYKIAYDKFYKKEGK